MLCSDPPTARPYLLSVDNVLVTHQTRLSLKACQVGARVRFRKTLAPDFFGAENFGNVPLLLRFHAVRNNCRPISPRPSAFAIGGAPTRAISSQKIDRSISLAPRPPILVARKRLPTHLRGVFFAMPSRRKMILRSAFRAIHPNLSERCPRAIQAIRHETRFLRE